MKNIRLISYCFISLCTFPTYFRLTDTKIQRERGLAGQWRKIIPEWNVGRIQWKDDSGQQESGDNRSDYFETVILPSPSLFQERDRRVWGVKQDGQDLGADGPEHAGEDS